MIEKLENKDKTIGIKKKDFLEMIKKIQDPKDLGYIYFTLGISNKKEGNIEEGIKNFLEAISKYKEALKLDLEDRLIIGNANLKLGQLFLEKGDVKKERKNYQQARLFYLKARLKCEEAILKYIELLNLDFEKEKIEKYLENGYLNLGETYFVLGDLDIKQGDNKNGKNKFLQAKSIYKAALKLNSENRLLENLLASVYLSLGNINIKEGAIDKAENFFLKAISKYEKVLKLDFNNNFARVCSGNGYLNLGNIHIYKGDRDGGKDYYSEAIKKYKSVKDDCFSYMGLGKIYTILGNICIEEGNKENGKNNYWKAIKKYEKANNLNEKNKEPLFYLGGILIEYLKISDYKKDTLFYLKQLEISKKEVDDNQPIEKILKNGCYLFFENLKKIDFLDGKIRDYLKLNIPKSFREQFKIKSTKRKIEYNDRYYMYKSINSNLLFSLNERKLRKGNPYLFNDPFDPYYKVSDTLIKDELKKIRISCFGEKKDSLLMWSHYGDEHKGVCIEYKNLEDKIGEYTYFDKVVYEEIKTHRKLIDNSDLLLLDEMKIDEELLTINEMCLRKHKDWQYENEWRMISLEKEDKNELYYDNMEISKIFFGMKCEDSNIKLITKLLKDRMEIIFYKMTQGDNLTLDSREIELDENRDVILDGKGKIKLKEK